MFCGFLGETYGLSTGIVSAVIGGATGGFIWTQVAINRAMPYIREELNSCDKVPDV